MTPTHKHPSASNFRTTFLADRGAVVLAEHALGLPLYSPARETIRLVLDRRTEGQPFDPDAPAPLSRDELMELVANQSDADAVELILQRLSVTEDDLAEYREDNDAETIMAEAA